MKIINNLKLWQNCGPRLALELRKSCDPPRTNGVFGRSI